MPAVSSSEPVPSLAVVDANEVHLIGRLSAVAEHLPMPSGDVAAKFRLIVARPPGGVSRVRSDALDCVSYRKAVVRSSRGWVEGDRLEVTGALRRRFWRNGTGVASMVDVEVLSVRRIAAGAKGGATSRPKRGAEAGTKAASNGAKVDTTLDDDVSAQVSPKPRQRRRRGSG